MSSLDFIRPRKDTAYSDTEQIITLGQLITEARKSNDKELVEIYRERLREVQESKQNTEIRDKQRKKFRERALGIAAFVGTGSAIVGGLTAISLGIQHDKDNAKAEFVEQLTAAAADDGFEYVSHKKYVGGSVDLTVEAAPNCTLTTVKLDYDKDNRSDHEIWTYTFETSEGEVTVQSAAEVIGRYGTELCQIKG